MSRRDRRVAARTKAVTPPQAARADAPASGAARTRPRPGAARRRHATGGGDPARRLRPVHRSRQALVNAMVSDQHRQLTTLAGGRCFAGEVPAVPELLAEEVWAGLQDDKRLAYDEDRLDHHSRLLVIQTAVIRTIITEGRKVFLPEPPCHLRPLRPDRVRASRTGKTTAVTQLSAR